MAFNPINVVKLLYDQLSLTSQPSPPSPAEHDAKEQILVLLQQFQTGNLTSQETEVTLDLFDELDDEDDLHLNIDDDSDDSDDSLNEISHGMAAISTESDASTSATVAKRSRNFVDLNHKQEVVAFWRHEQEGKSIEDTTRKFSSVKGRYRDVTCVQQLYKWEKQLENTGSRVDCLRLIRKATFASFSSARLNNLTVHDADIKRWARDTARNLGFNTFKASDTWLRQFKLNFRIVGRKVTKFVSLNFNNEQQDVELTAMEFVHNTRQSLMDYYEGNVYNSDQSGFNKELHSGRTLAYKGQKSVFGTAQSNAALTHSYTIMPTISKTGGLGSPLYMVLQEANGEFGPLVSQSMYKAPNLYVDATRSGKMGKKEMKSWLKNGFFPQSGEKNALLIDSWSTFKDRDAINSMLPPGKTLDIYQIPAKTTGFIQPLDVIGFRSWKQYVRKISDRVLLDQLEFPLFQRNNILKLQSLTHNQLSSPRYKSLWLLSWYKSGYIDERPPHFIDPSHFLASGQDLVCDEDECDNVSFGKCSWCKKNYCFHHLLEIVHYCSEYVE